MFKAVQKQIVDRQLLMKKKTVKELFENQRHQLLSVVKEDKTRARGSLKSVEKQHLLEFTLK